MQDMETFVQTYARSVDTCDIDLAKSLWKQDGAIFFIHPSGCDHSFSEVAQHFYLDTMDARFSKRELVPKNLRCAQYGDTAVLEFEWDFYATARKDGSVVHTQGRESQVLVREDEGWKIALAGTMISSNRRRPISGRCVSYPTGALLRFLRLRITGLY